MEPTYVLRTSDNAVEAWSTVRLPFEPGGQVSRRLVDAGVGEQAPIRGMLADPAWGALGPRQLIKSFGIGGVQWNPADDYCKAATIVLDPAPGAGPRWQVSGELRRAVPR